MLPVVFTGISVLLPAIAFAQSSSSGLSTPSQPAHVQEIGPSLPLQPRSPEALETPSGETTSSQPSTSLSAPQSAQALGSGGSNFSKRISFDEFPQGTVINSQYRDQGIVFGGSELKIQSDIASSSSPVLAGTSAEGEPFEGEISGQFVIPGTNTPAPVYRMTWDIGYFNELSSVEMEFFGPAGQLLYAIRNNNLGILKYSTSGGSVGIASWRFHIVSTETAGFGIDNLSFSIPGQDDLDREKGEVECAEGNPVNPAVGNKYQMEIDYRGSRPFPLQASRAYNSIGGSWQIFPEIKHEPGEVAAQIIRPDGKGLSHIPFGGTNWKATSPEMTGQLDSVVDEFGATIGWRYRMLDDQIELYDAAGRLSSVTQRSGVSHSYTYSPAEITVTHSFGGSLTYALDAEGVITGFSDPDGNVYQYSYNANGLITRVDYPDGHGGRTYHYEDRNYDDLLTGISDANGDRFATWHYDSNRRAISSEHANSSEYTYFDYSFTDHPDYPQTLVTNAQGKDTTYHYFTVNGARKTFQLRGHASANCVAANQSYGYNARAFVASKTDWKGNVTAYVRNTKGQELSRTEAQGTAQERTITTQWHPEFNLPIKISEPGKETSFTYDANGNRLGKSVLDLSIP